VKFFNIGERVSVSTEGGWKKDFTGVIVDGPEAIDTLKGPENFCWVQFDEPQEDINGSDEYYKAQILSCYIDRIGE
jgi:hypothetical protein